ncbi:protein phosphatase 2C domain-containing protein [Anabaena cylindrica FACHB-243]|uniref:Protein serine/threonine phosphatase n=1 Tax=Anabaena cylindrica (strain ATCC 27899 / PCC 7122) TaxID=272123 RepID=K9ZEF9_ANACC|nr:MULTISPECIES: protein phosphatase 2C domain-containing protein [Anabaena]AFZ56992.1 protein serine/threonine phosphatase [Anabaena cylindrica PCC 7122]MBD2418365.1 protein phosphatase 2C domain-containing protein [Anabaena cylindrica FACHB-243]MBY5281179.1 serine/threonine protein phosphatase [Anabaena sp. CCAP 1446/1C]MBY5308708.1 serine/threonine protein phosphatase [Anabaena sp. CCAP 1446/1C]MCM2410281.1 protein phosphatase 2C domain-containing protein [Anabaena sp. CCAP 1446/1C]
MENDAATLYCPNEYCQAANPLTYKFCQRCSTPLPKRYLRAVGDSLNLGIPGEILADRYLVINQSIIFDLKPGLLPQIPELDNLQQIKAYLKLIPYRLHIPQIYGMLSINEGQSLLLLEQPPLVADSADSQIHLCSKLTTAWGDASSMRQMNWLWQLAHLWQPLWTEGVASSLLDSNLLRVEGSLVRLLELHFDSQTAPTLSQLGEFWQQLLKEAKPAIAEFVKQISNSLIHGEINTSELLIKVLDQGLARLGQTSSGRNSPTQTTIKIVTQTDTGPSRQRNEDACYPSSGVVVSKPPQQTALAIVCDGIGGHEGGNIASSLAIETIQQQVKELTSVPYENIDPLLLLNDLEQAVALVNDKISQRNDTEHRQGRQRMGTTLVMALPIAHEMYITHIGDSRAYWITRHGCYQVTLDDDVASREVRLGYAVYREALQHSGSGSLVQALGMGKSVSLHPTSQRFIIDEDAVFLLTSDGLSDFDRVEEYWETEILPIISGDTNIENAAQRLIEIANTKNGHDNVTIALVHSQVKYSEPEVALKADIITTISASKTVDLTPRTTNSTTLGNSHQQTQVIPETKPVRASQLPLQLLILLGVLLAAGSLGYWLKIQRQIPSRITDPLIPFVSPQPTITETPSPETLDKQEDFSPAPVGQPPPP